LLLQVSSRHASSLFPRHSSLPRSFTPILFPGRIGQTPELRTWWILSCWPRWTRQAPSWSKRRSK
jgi:hypothetical protein